MNLSSGTLTLAPEDRARLIGWGSPFSLEIQWRVVHFAPDMMLDGQSLLKTLPLQIASQLAAAIAKGEFGPGHRFRETELAQRFSVSRASIREALRLLEMRGIVSILPQKGARVTELSSKELHDLFAIRASLLATCSRLVAEQCDDAKAKVLRSRLANLASKVQDADAYIEQSGRLVELIAEMADNPTLAGYVSDLALRIGRYVRMGLLAEERRRRSLATWEELIETIIRGDAEAASGLHYRLALQNRDAALKTFEEQRM
jgi:DNA-binding GntR family transcriptional regulator